MSGCPSAPLSWDQAAGALGPEWGKAEPSRPLDHGQVLVGTRDSGGVVRKRACGGGDSPGDSGCVGQEGALQEGRRGIQNNVSAARRAPEGIPGQ